MFDHALADQNANQIIPPRPLTPSWEGKDVDPEEKHGPAKDLKCGKVKMEKALDLNPPNREAMIQAPEAKLWLSLTLRDGGWINS